MLARMTPLHRRLRDAARATGLDLNSLARQAEVSRADLAAVLWGSPGATFDAVSAVAVRLGFSVRVERQEPARHLQSTVETVVDKALRRIALPVH